MSDFILEYDNLEAIAVYSRTLGQRAEEYSESLERKIIGGIETVTGPSSAYLLRANDSVMDKINALKRKAEDFYHFAEQITKLLETAQQRDQEVVDAITGQGGIFLEHHQSLRMEDWKVNLINLFVDTKNSPFLMVMAELLKGQGKTFSSMKDSINHWYRCEGGRLTLEEEALGLMKKGPISFFDLNKNIRNGNVELISSSQIEGEPPESTFWSVTGNFFGGVWDGVYETTTGAIDAIKHPIKTVKETGTALSHPILTGQTIYTAIKEGFTEDVINGTPDTRAHFIGEALSEVGLSLIGTKGVTKVIKANKTVAKASSLLGKLKNTSTGLTKASNAINEVNNVINKANNSINKAGSSLKDEIKKMYKSKVNKVVDEVVEDGSKAIDNVIEGAGKNFKFSELTDDEIANIAKEYQKKSPIEIPEGASYKAQSKTGFEQISYKWNDGTYKYESRWHTRTPGAPETQGNTWVIQRTKPGSGGTKPYTEFLAGDDWVPATKWYDSIMARKAGTATTEQIEILDKGHWKE